MSQQSVDVTAGLGGFTAFFLLALALYFLMRNMTARLRRMAYREEQEARAAEDFQGGDGFQGDDGQGLGPPDSSGPQGGPALG
jgi:hypothetical protein